jgi:uncharacterized peroxidase-related enzyme
MSRYVIHTADTAAETARATFAAVEDTMGFVPNILAVLGGTPNVFDALVAMNTTFAAGQLTPIEREIVQLAVSVENGCGYCVAGHSAFAANHGMSAAEIAALRTDGWLADYRKEALRVFARTLAAGMGHGADCAYVSFRMAGYSREQAHDVILGVAVKMFTNTLSILMNLPLDDAFKPYAWSPQTVNLAAAA